MKEATILLAISTQLMVCLDGLFLPQLRLTMKSNPSRSLFFLLDILPYLVIGIFLALTAILTAQKQTGKKVAGYLVPLFFTISNLLFLLLYFIGVIPLSTSSMMLPLLLIGYGIGGFVYSYSQAKSNL